MDSLLECFVAKGVMCSGEGERLRDLLSRGAADAGVVLILFQATKRRQTNALPRAKNVVEDYCVRDIDVVVFDKVLQIFRHHIWRRAKGRRLHVCFAYGEDKGVYRHAFGTARPQGSTRCLSIGLLLATT
jgi:hypothetical protein